MLQKEELEISTSCWLCLQMSHAWKAVPLTVSTANVTKCLIPQQMTVYPDDDVNVDDQQYDDTSSGSYSEMC